MKRMTKMLTGIESRILDDMLQSISQGKYKAHDRLPSENELANYYNVPRINAEKVFLKMEDMGFIYSKRGKGRFLKPEKQRIELYLTGSSSFSGKMKAAGYNLEIQNLGYVKVPYDSKIYANLQVESDEEVFMISRLYLIESQGVALHISYVAKSVFPNIERDGDSIQSMSAYYADQGFMDFSRGKNYISISFPTSIERSLFNCSRLVPLLVVENNCTEINQNKILEYTKIIYRSDHFSYVIEDK